MKDKLLNLLLIASIAIFVISCKKEKKAETDHLHMSYNFNGAYKNMQPPAYGYGCGSSPGSGISFHYSKDLPNMPGSDLQFMFQLNGRMETKTYTIPRNKYFPIRLTYIDTSQMEYTMETGTFSLSKVDSTGFIYKGNFEGIFINDIETDSFVLTNGDFFFQAP